MMIKVVIEKTERRTIWLGTNSSPGIGSKQIITEHHTLPQIETKAKGCWDQYPQQPAEMRMVSIEVDDERVDG